MSAATETLKAKKIHKFPSNEGWICWEIKVLRWERINNLSDMQEILNMRFATGQAEIGYFRKVANWVIVFYKQVKEYDL